MNTLTIEILTDSEKEMARRILKLTIDIEGRKIKSLILSFLFTLALLGVIIAIDLVFLLKYKLSFLETIGLPINSAPLMFLLFIIPLTVLSCIFSIPLYYVFLLPRARLRVLELKDLLATASDDFFQKLQSMRTLEDIIPERDIIDFSSPVLEPGALKQFLARSLSSIHVKI